MLKKLIALANKLDALGEYELANELDQICREAAKPMRWVDKRPESERAKDLTGKEWQDELMWKEPYERDVPFERVEKELKPRPGEEDPRRWLLDEEGVHEETREEGTPEERVKPLFRGKKEDIDPDELSKQDLPENYLTEIEDIDQRWDEEEREEEERAYRKLWEE